MLRALAACSRHAAAAGGEALAWCPGGLSVQPLGGGGPRRGLLQPAVRGRESPGLRRPPGRRRGKAPKIAEAGFPLHPSGKYPIIMSTEETALRFLRAAVAAQFHKNGSFEPLLWNSAIVAMRISTGAPQRSRGRCKVFGQFRPKTLHRNNANQPCKPWLSRLAPLFRTHYHKITELIGGMRVRCRGSSGGTAPTSITCRHIPRIPHRRNPFRGPRPAIGGYFIHRNDLLLLLAQQITPLVRQHSITV